MSQISLSNITYAIVGLPNVGKSLLFNRMTSSRKAIVHDFPGVTRDRQTSACQLDESTSCELVDTGGLETEQGLEHLDAALQKAHNIQQHRQTDQVLKTQVARQLKQAVGDSTCILFVVDAQKPLDSATRQLAQQLHQLSIPVWLVLNKIDGIDPWVATSDFSELGFEDMHLISAKSGHGMGQFKNALLALTLNTLEKQQPNSTTLPAEEDTLSEPQDEDEIESNHDISTSTNPKIALIGRPNAGKSSLTNTLARTERMIVSEIPGTTRDAVTLACNYRGFEFDLIDTAGLRRERKAKTDLIERFSIYRSLESMRSANVVILMLDAHAGIVEQDRRLHGLLETHVRPMVIAINKWDLLSEEAREAFKSQFERHFSFNPHIPVVPVSAKTGRGLKPLMDTVQRVYKASQQSFTTAYLTRLLHHAANQHQPPIINSRRIRLNLAHPSDEGPGHITILGKQTDKVPVHYRRYLMNYFAKHCELTGIPLKLEFKTDHNPYEKAQT